MAHPNDEQERTYRDLLSAVQAALHQRHRIRGLLESLQQNQHDMSEVQRRLRQDTMLLNPAFSEDEATGAIDAVLTR